MAYNGQGPGKSTEPMRRRILTGDGIAWLEDAGSGVYLVYSGASANGSSGSIVRVQNGSAAVFSWSTRRGRGGIAPTLDAAIARVLTASGRR
jgi:hypothetical protein